MEKASLPARLLVLMVGPQGSGKTTYCQEKLPGYFRVSQDEMGKAKYKKCLEEAIDKGEPLVVVDRINHKRDQRGDFLIRARKNGYATKIVWLNVDKETCLKRVLARKGHPTLDSDNAEQALNMFFNEFQVPAKCEADELVVVGAPAFGVSTKDLVAEIGDRRYIIVGDIHGCLDELKEMLSERGFDHSEDVLVCVGDLVDRGPKIRETLEFVMALPRFHCARGNHDDKCLRAFEGKPVKVAHGLQMTLDSFGGKPPLEVVNFMRSLPYVLRVPAGYVVHAGFDPMLPVEQQKRADCLFMRYYGGANYFDDMGTLWYKLWPREFPNVFFGHIPDPAGPAGPNVFSLDGGCVFGGYLKAWDSRDGVVHYVKAHREYSRNEYQESQDVSGSTAVSKREEYVVGGLLRSDRTDDGKLAIYTYTDQCTFDRAWDDITRNSRGHVFDLKTGECIAMAMPKFFNLGENEESLFEKFAWDQPYEVFEKADGWLGVLIRHDDKFKVASRGSFHSDGSLWATSFIQGVDLSFLPDDVTLCFEIIHPRHKIILDYAGKETLVILCAFNRKTGEEYPRVVVEEWGTRTGLPVVKKWNVDINHCLAAQKEARDMEGFVIRFQDGRRVKVKTEWYMGIAKLMSNTTPIATWEAMENGNGKVRQDFMAAVPEEIRPIAERHRDTLEAQYAMVRDWLVAATKDMVSKHGADKKALALNREHLRGTIAFGGIFAVVDGKEKMIDKIVRGAIYPASNEIVAVDKLLSKSR